VLNSTQKVNPNNPPDLLSEYSFNIIKKLFIYGTQNLELQSIIYPPMKDIIREVKDFEHSYEVKLAIYSYVTICKEKDVVKQDEILKYLLVILKQLLEYIAIIDNKFGALQMQQ
jgi:hypothetical protein